MSTPYRILDRKRRGASLAANEIQEVVRGATDGSWSDPQLAAFLMAVAVQGLDQDEMRWLTSGMLESGERWHLSQEFPQLGDKHSTGGVGDKVSLVLAPVLAACDVPIAMLTGRGLGHTGGTADKLEGIPGLELGLSRKRIVGLLGEVGMAVGMATGEIAPADRKLYSLRDVTGTVVSVPLIVASIVSKKLALGARGIVYDVKTGSGAFLSDLSDARRLAELLVETSRALGAEASALLTDMSQPLGRWVGHHAEVNETLESLRGDGPEDLVELVVEQAIEVGRLVGRSLDRASVESTITSGSAYEVFMRWAVAQGADPAWCDDPWLGLAPVEVAVQASGSGFLSAVETREIGLILAQAGGGRQRPGDVIDHGVAFHYQRRIGDRLEAGETIGRLHLRRPDDELVARLAGCFDLADEVAPPNLIRDRVVAEGNGVATRPPG